MTDEERQKLCKLLRLHGSELGEEAADEIERLAKELALLKDEYNILLERTTNMLDMTVR